MKFFKGIFKVILLSIMIMQIGTADMIGLNGGVSFEGEVVSKSEQSHTFKIPKSQIKMLKYKDNDSDYIMFINDTNISTKVIKFVENNYYIEVENSLVNEISSVSTPSVAIVDTIKSDDGDRDFLFKLHGSNTIGANLAPSLVEAYLSSIGAKDIKVIEGNAEEKEIYATLADGKKTKVEIYAHGSSTAFKALKDSSCDIGMASRRVTDEEANSLDELCNIKSVKHEHIIAIDGVAIFVNKKNPIFKLTIEQIRDIYTGKIKDWSEVGGDNGKINLYARDKNSGTWETFEQFILDKTPLSNDVKKYEDNTLLSNDVSHDINGIGFGGLPYILNTKELAISDGEMTIKPDEFTVATEDYPLSRRLYFYNINRENKNINDFLEFALSSEGQEIVKNAQFVDLNIKAFKPIITDTMPEVYKVLAKKFLRLSTSFRFEPNSRNLDNKAQIDLDRVVAYLEKNVNIKSKNIYLIGFSDNKGSEKSNIILSKQRAKSVLYALKSKNIVVHKDMIIPLGQDCPVANNIDEKGRAKNRRVEIWIRS